MTATVYRCFDGAGRLLYVGFSRNIGRRLKQHKAASLWFPMVAKVDRVIFSDKSDALEEERRAIRDERPLCNLSGNAAVDVELLASLCAAKSRAAATTTHLVSSDNVVISAIRLIEALRARLSTSMAEEAAIFAQAKAAGFSKIEINKSIARRSALGMA